MPNSVILTRASDDGFSYPEIGADFSNVQVYRVIKSSQTIKGNPKYITIEYADNDDVADPNSDPLVFCTITKKSENIGITHCECRALWDNKSWRILDSGVNELFKLLGGVTEHSLQREFSFRYGEHGEQFRDIYDT